MTLSTKDNEKLLQQLKASFKITINWNKYQVERKIYTKSQYLNHLINPSFQGVIRLFILSFEDDELRRSCKRYFLPTVEIKDYNVMIEGKNFDQPVKNNIITYENIQKIASG